MHAWIYLMGVWGTVGLYFVFLTMQRRNPYYAELFCAVGASLVPVVNLMVLGVLLYKVGKSYLRDGLPIHMRPTSKLTLFE